MSKKIMLDAGHYAKYNRSPVVKEYYESEMAWKLQLFLKKELEGYGFKVDTTRADQTKDLEVTKRGKMAKGYDLFLSLHSNGVWDNSKSVSDPVNIKNEAVDRVSIYHSYSNANNSFVLADKLGKMISGVMGVAGGYNVKTKPHNFSYGMDEYYGVLRGAKSVGCPLYYILEHSFHTNTRSTNWLLKEENLQELAEMEALAIAEYYGVIRKPILGDINGDGKVDAFDYLMAKRAYLGTLTLTPKQARAARISGGEEFISFDALKIRRIALGTYTPTKEEVEAFEKDMKLL